MSNQLYLLRHAKAEPWSPLGNDFSRALSPKGVRHAHHVANWALETLTPPDTVLCSPAKRTRETLGPLLSNWPQSLANTDYVESMYGASLNMILTLIEDAFTYSERLLMVGHNPGFENALLNVLHPQFAGNITKMSTGTLAVIEFSDNFKRDTRAGGLLHLVSKKDFLDN